MQSYPGVRRGRNAAARVGEAAIDVAGVVGALEASTLDAGFDDLAADKGFEVRSKLGEPFGGGGRGVARQGAIYDRLRNRRVKIRVAPLATMILVSPCWP